MTTEGMAGQNRLLDMKRIEDRENVVSQSLCAVTELRVAGGTVSAAGYGVNVT